MNRMTVVLLAALDALIVVAIGIGIALVPLTVLWATQFQLAIDWGVFWKAAADIWLLGHGVNLTFALSPLTAASLGLPHAGVPFQVTIAVLGFALLAVLLGARTGARAAQTRSPWAGAIASVVCYGILGTVITLTAGSTMVTVSLWQGIALPPFVFAIGVAIGLGAGSARVRRAAASDDRGAAASAGGRRPGVATWAESNFRTGFSSGLAAALRAGTAASALVIAASAVLVTALLFGHFGVVIGLYEQLQAGFLGATALTIAQLALLPNTVIWVASWLLGPGFAIGTGSSIGPAGTQVGPLPSLPLLGILPQGSGALGFAGLLVPVLAGFLGAMLFRRRVARLPGGVPKPGRLIVIALGAAAVAGVQLGLLAWWSSGAVGPGRLHDAGPNGWIVAGCAAAAIAVGALVGILTTGRHAQ
ncbi:MAG: hypothetical protein EPN48_08410 [Microbacteriaceae bacterium]|nr:MAG: hypothetical protein EPN48_08410 [Microbacteriaceae bacterium]